MLFFLRRRLVRKEDEDRGMALSS